MAWVAAPIGGRTLRGLIPFRLRWVLAVPFVGLVFLIASGGPLLVALMLGLGTLAVTISVATRYPQFAVLGLVTWIPIQVPILAFAYWHGVPVLVVRSLGFLKEFWAVSLLVAAISATRKRRLKADLLDWIALLYVGSATLYFLLPIVDSHVLGGQEFHARLNAWRLDVLFVIIFLCVRRLTFDVALIHRVQRSVCIVGIILGGFSLWEISDKTGFNNFLVNTLGYTAYLTGVIGAPPAMHAGGSILDSTQVGNSSITRAGSLFNDPLLFGFFMVIPLGIAIERTAARKISTLAYLAATAAVGGIIFSNTRGAVLAAAVCLVLALGFGISRMATNRFRLILASILACVALLPLAIHSSLLARMETILHPSTDKNDTALHVERSREGLHELITHPLGRGLGSNTSTASLFDTSSSITTEDSYLETGNELGLPAVALFMTALGMLLYALRRRSQTLSETAGLAGGAFLAGCGLAVGAFVLQTWYELAVAMVFWTIAGLALSHTGTSDSTTEVTSDDETTGDRFASIAGPV